MQKKLIAMAVAGLLAAPAFAQSSVQMYGRVDMGYNAWTNDGAGSFINEESSNRLGFKGEEDLGNGWKAFFQLENRFYLDNGTQNTNRQWKDKAWVGIGNNVYGSISAGRIHSANYNIYGGGFEAFGGDTIASAPNRRGKITSIWSNAVQYESAKLANMFTVIGTIGPSETGGSNRWGTAVKFDYANFKAEAGYQKDTTTDGADGNITDAASLNPFKTWSLTAGYNFGFMELFGGYANSQSWNLEGFNDANGGHKAKLQVYTAGVRVPLGNGKVMANYEHATGKYIDPRTASVVGTDKPENFDHIGLGYWYNLSKRTILMANFAYNMQKEAYNGKDDSFGYQFAVRHSF